MKKFLALITLIATAGCASSGKLADLEAKVNASEVRNECVALTVASMMSYNQIMGMIQMGVEEQTIQQNKNLHSNLILQREAMCAQAYPNRNGKEEQ